MNVMKGFERRVNTILLITILLLALSLVLAWEKYSEKKPGSSDRLSYASELLAHGLPFEASTVLQTELENRPVNQDTLKLRMVHAEILIDKIGDYEKALSELVFIRLHDPSMASATENMVQRCMDRLGRVYDVQRRLILDGGKNPLESRISSETAVRFGNEGVVSISEVERKLAQLGLPTKNPPPEQLNQIVQGMAGEILLRRAAKRANIDRQPQFLEQVRQFEANLILQKYLEDHVLKDVKVDEQALSLFLEKNRNLFESPLRVVYSALRFPDEASAKAFVNGQAPASQPETITDHSNVVTADLPRPLKNIPWETEPVKGALGPVEVDGKWMVYPIHEVIQATRTPPELAHQQARLKLLEEKQSSQISKILSDLAQKEEMKIIEETIKPHFFSVASKTETVQPANPTGAVLQVEDDKSEPGRTNPGTTKDDN